MSDDIASFLQNLEYSFIPFLDHKFLKSLYSLAKKDNWNNDLVNDRLREMGYVKTNDGWSHVG